MKEMNDTKGANRYEHRFRSLNKGKVSSLGLWEKWTMQYLGWMDGSHGLLRCNEDGIWQSSVLKGEVDSYEEFCAKEMGTLKLVEEAEFKKMNTLFDSVVPLRTKISEAREKLKLAEEEPVDLSLRKAGEENLTDAQVALRRNREHEKKLKPFKEKIAACEQELSETIRDIFASLSQIKESFDSANKITDRVLQHCQRRVDVYWRTAMKHMEGLPALPDVIFSEQSRQAFAEHYDKVEEKAEKLRGELALELNGEVN